MYEMNHRVERNSPYTSACDDLTGKKHERKSVDSSFYDEAIEVRNIVDKKCNSSKYVSFLQGIEAVSMSHLSDPNKTIQSYGSNNLVSC